jgi:sporulation protein YlmC with PRC-barrel domain
VNVEELRLDADVVSSDGHTLGKLSKFVFEKDTYRLTHIVVDTGILRSGEALWKGGWGLSHDRMVPLQALDNMTSDRIQITMTGDEFREHSIDFSEEYLVPVRDWEPGAPDISDIRRIAMEIPGEPGAELMQQVKAIGPNLADIREDSPVWLLNPHKKIGEVERVLFDEDSGELQALVIRRGFIFTKDVVLPREHIVEVVAEIVRVQADQPTLDALADYHPAG